MTESKPVLPGRLASVDAYRGPALALMTGEASPCIPPPPSDIDWEAGGVPGDWPHPLTGFEGHWNKNWLIGALRTCPVVKRIWTPSFTLWSGGRCFLFLAAFYLVREPLLLGAAALLVLWLVLFWMYRRRIFLRI